MKIKSWKMVGLSVLGAALLAGCENNSTVSRDTMNLKDLGDMAICIREEGSGTHICL